MLPGYDGIKNLYSVSATPQILLEWNANKFGNTIVAGTTNKPDNTMLTTQYLFNVGTTYNRDNTTANNYTTAVATYTSTSYSNIPSGGNGSIFSDTSFQVITANNSANVQGYGSPLDATKVFDITQLFSGVTSKQELYALKISFWVRTTYSSLKPNVSPDINIFVKADTPANWWVTDPIITNSKTQTVTTRAISADWTQVIVEWAPEVPTSTQIKYLRLNIQSESFLDSYPEIAIDDLQIFRVSKRQAKQTDDYTDVSSLFKVNRPGEYLVRYLEDGISNSIGQSCHSTPLAVGFGNNVSQTDIDETKAVLFDDLYISNDNFASYITDIYGTDSVMPVGGSDKIWALYEKEFSVNKIVIKQNNNLSYCSSNIYVLTKSGGTFTWSLAGSVTPNYNGVAALYYNGSTWSTNKWSIRPTMSTGSLSTYINICGVALERSTAPTIGNAWKNFSSFQQQNAKLQFIEISPRLQIDATNFLESYRMSKEMAADDDPLPIGQATSNNLNLTMNNIPIMKGSPDSPVYSNKDDIIVFNNDSITSPITSLLQKDCQCFLYLNIGGSVIPQFSGYINDWSIGENDATAQAYDIIKTFQDRNLYATKQTINNCGVNFAVEITLRNAGINDFDLAALKRLTFNSQSYQSKNIKYYWIEKNENAADSLDEIAKIYQMIIYADEYGKLVIDSLSNIMTYSSVSASISDIGNASMLPNIVSVSEITSPIPKEFSINYSIASPPTINTGSIFINNSVPIWQPDADVVALSNVELAQTLKAGDTSIRLTDMTTFLNGLYDYQGYLIIDREIVSYNGVEYNIAYKTAISGAWMPYNDGKITVYNPETLKYYENLLLSQNAVAISIKPNAVLKNVQRGLFGTVELDHGAEAGIASKWAAYTCNMAGSLNIYNSPFYAANSTSTPIQYVTNGSPTGTISIPKNQGLIVNANFSSNGWSYFRTVQRISNPTDSSAFYTGIFIGSANQSTQGLYVGVGRRINGKFEQSIIVKSLGQLSQTYELNENDFGTEFINPSGSLSEAIKFEVFFRNYGTGTYNAAKIYINDTLITSSAVFNSSNKNFSGVQFTNDDYLLLYANQTVPGFGVFSYSDTTTSANTLLYEMSFTSAQEEVNYLGLNQATSTDEKNLINKILNNIDANGLASQFTAPSYFYWTGTNNIRQLKIFDIDLDQIPIQSNAKFFTGSYSYLITALKNNYI